MAEKAGCSQGVDTASQAPELAAPEVAKAEEEESLLETLGSWAWYIITGGKQCCSMRDHNRDAEAAKKAALIGRPPGFPAPGEAAAQAPYALLGEDASAPRVPRLAREQLDEGPKPELVGGGSKADRAELAVAKDSTSGSCHRGVGMLGSSRSSSSGTGSSFNGAEDHAGIVRDPDHSDEDGEEERSGQKPLIQQGNPQSAQDQMRSGSASSYNANFPHLLSPSDRSLSPTSGTSTVRASVASLPQHPDRAPAHNSSSSGSRRLQSQPGPQKAWHWPSWALQFKTQSVEVYVEDDEAETADWVAGIPLSRVIDPDGNDAFLHVEYSWDGEFYVQDFGPEHVRQKGRTTAVHALGLGGQT